MNGGTVPGRHEGAGAVHVADGFRHRLAHVGALVKHQLHERGALDALALDVIDAGDVEEVILVVVSEVAFHLRGVHAAVGLRDVDGGVADLREDVDRHALEREDGAERDGDQRDHYGDRSAESGQDEAHVGLPAGLGHEGLNVAGGGGHAEQSAPDAEAGQGIVDLGLREQALRFGDFVDVAEARLDSARSPAAVAVRAADTWTGVLAATRRAPFSVATARFHWARRSVAICSDRACLRADGGGLARPRGRGWTAGRRPERSR